MLSPSLRYFSQPGSLVSFGSLPLSTPVTRNSTTSLMLRAPMSGNAGIRPVPWRMSAAISSRVWRSPTPMSDGADGDPLRSSRWHVAHLLLYSDVSLFGISLTIHGISFEFTYNSADAGSNAAPPHSAPPSTPGKMIVPSKDGGAKKPLE